MKETLSEKDSKNIVKRPPVVVVLGHVDHGKSSLIEKIKEIKITDKEAGGITQHIGAYQVEHQIGEGKEVRKITFIDTPGHEAFGAMRSRGAKVADIAVLVVAGDEGVKPQTIEAISCVKKADIPMIVAINKIDKPSAQPEKVKQELAKHGVVVESLGGNVPCVEVSAKTGKGITDLLELILLVAEMEELKADLNALAQGVIIESYLDSQRGPTATLLVRDGVLRKGDIIATTSTFGKIKNLEDFQGNPLDKAFPSTPCVVLGFQEVPRVGEKFKIFKDMELAQDYVQKEEKKTEEREVIEISPEKKILNLILKADVLGSLEAIEGVIKSLPQEKIILRILKKEPGEITEGDVKLAKSSQAKILGFRVKVNSSARKLAERENITILNFEVIYDLSQAVRNLMEKLLEPKIEKIVLGKLKILAVFRREKNRQIIGGKVIEGEVKVGAKARIIRPDLPEKEMLGEGKIINLQKDKKDTPKVVKGQECGLLFESEVKIEEGDILEVYIEERKKEKL